MRRFQSRRARSLSTSRHPNTHTDSSCPCSPKPHRDGIACVPITLLMPHPRPRWHARASSALPHPLLSSLGSAPPEPAGNTTGGYTDMLLQGTKAAGDRHTDTRKRAVTRQKRLRPQRHRRWITAMKGCQRKGEPQLVHVTLTATQSTILPTQIPSPFSQLAASSSFRPPLPPPPSPPTHLCCQSRQLLGHRCRPLHLLKPRRCCHHPKERPRQPPLRHLHGPAGENRNGIDEQSSCPPRVVLDVNTIGRAHANSPRVVLAGDLEALGCAHGVVDVGISQGRPDVAGGVQHALLKAVQGLLVLHLLDVYPRQRLPRLCRASYQYRSIYQSRSIYQYRSRRRGGERRGGEGEDSM